MVERMPPVRAAGGGATEGPDWAPPATGSTGGNQSGGNGSASGSGGGGSAGGAAADATSGRRSSRIGSGDARPARIVVRARLEEATRFRAGVPVDAFVPNEPFNHVVTFRVVEVIEGSWPGETLHAVVRSPFEQFAFPFSDVRDFRLVLSRSPSPQYHLVEWDPTGEALKERARREREREREKATEPDDAAQGTGTEAERGAESGQSDVASRNRS